MPQLTTEGLSVAYETAGSGHTAVLLLHGNFASPRWWRPVLERPPSGLTLYAPVLGGFAGSEAPQRFTIEAYAAQLRAFAKGLGLERAWLVGHSLGGAVALQYALDWPHEVLGLGLVAPAPGDGLLAMRSRLDLLGHVTRWTDPTFSASRMALFSALRVSRALGTRRGTIGRALARMMPSARPEAVDFEGLLHDALEVREAVTVGVYEALRRWDVRDRLAGLEVPVRILGGRDDTLVPAASLEQLAREVPGAQLELWEGTGHSPQLERPEAFARWLAKARRSRFERLLAAVRRVVDRLRAALGGRPGPAELQALNGRDEP